MRAALPCCLALALALAACGPGGKHETVSHPSAKPVNDASAPRSCRDWTIQIATLTCATQMMHSMDAQANAQRLAAGEEKLSRYQGLGPSLCKNPAAAQASAKAVTTAATAETLTRASLDSLSDTHMLMSLCSEAALKQVARDEGYDDGRKAMAELHPGHQEDATALAPASTAAGN